MQGLIEQVEEAKRQAQTGDLTPEQMAETLHAVQCALVYEESKGTHEALGRVIESLTYTEMQVATELARVLTPGDTMIITTRIAEQLHVSRSVVTTVLEKLRIGGVVEYRSLGMKGTHIRVLIPEWFDLMLMDE